VGAAPVKSEPIQHFAPNIEPSHEIDGPDRLRIRLLSHHQAKLILSGPTDFDELTVWTLWSRRSDGASWCSR